MIAVILIILFLLLLLLLLLLYFILQNDEGKQATRNKVAEVTGTANVRELKFKLLL